MGHGTRCFNIGPLNPMNDFASSLRFAGIYNDWRADSFTLYQAENLAGEERFVHSDEESLDLSNWAQEGLIYLFFSNVIFSIQKQEMNFNTYLKN